MQRHPRRASWPALVLAVALAASSGAVAAATFTVTSLADSGPGSLRQAVLDANAAAGADEVVFAPGLAGTITLTSNEIVISDPLTVDGPGAAALTVSGGDQFRVFYVEKAGVAEPIEVAISGLTLTHGRGFPVHLFSFGGAVFANGESLTILGSVISDSVAGFQADPPDDGCGGNVAFFEGGTLRIANSRLTGGRVLGLFAAASGGNLCVIGGRLLLERSTLSGGDAENGGGLYARALTAGSSILQSTIAGNEAEVRGGGIYLESALNLKGVAGTGGLTIDSSTVSGNSATREAAIGGGIYVDHDNLRLLNSTVSGNRADDSGGGIYLALFPGLDSSLQLRLTTVADNTAGRSGGSLLVAGASATPDVNLDHAIVAGGSPQDLAGEGPVPMTFTANHSLVEAPGAVLLAGTGNLTGADPLLGPLGSHGGPTQTRLLLPGSPAIDAGDPSIPGPPATDQRGAPRIVGPAIDLGAVEGQPGLIEVPALSPAGLALLCALLGAAGAWWLRSVRRPHRPSA